MHTLLWAFLRFNCHYTIERKKMKEEMCLFDRFLKQFRKEKQSFLFLLFNGILIQPVRPGMRKPDETWKELEQYGL